MKKIMFNDKYGLTQAVLERIKTITRRVDKRLNDPRINHISEWGTDEKGKANIALTYLDGSTEVIYPAYQIGEEVAVAQSYASAINPLDWANRLIYKDTPGWNNKMFVVADLMPHRIRITDIKLERLQDISDEDCLKEGIFEDAEEHGGLYTTPFYDFYGNQENGFYEPREAYAALIDRICGKGTWDANPWVFAYEFKQIELE